MLRRNPDVAPRRFGVRAAGTAPLLASEATSVITSTKGVPTDFPMLLGEIKSRIQQAQTRAVLSVNAELVRLYWDIGRIIAGRQQQEGWGAAVIPRLARELTNELPEEKGFSERNIKLMVRLPTSIPTRSQTRAQLGNQWLPNCQQRRKGNHRLPKSRGRTTSS